MKGVGVFAGRFPFPSHCGSRSNVSVFCRVGEGSADQAGSSWTSRKIRIVTQATRIDLPHSAEFVRNLMARGEGFGRILRTESLLAVLAPRHCPKRDSCLARSFSIAHLIPDIDRLLRLD